jgi:hypothetical protein
MTKPRFIAWYGGVRPTSEQVEVLTDKKELFIRDAERLNWKHYAKGYVPNIIAYRVIEQE